MLSKNQLGFLYMFLSVCAFSIMDLLVIAIEKNSEISQTGSVVDNCLMLIAT